MSVMSVVALQQIQQLRGCSQPRLMLCSDGNLHVVKCFKNPQHARVLANEILMSLLAELIGLPVPECSIVRITDRSLLASCSDDSRPEQLTDWQITDAHFGSRFVGGLMPGLVTDYLPTIHLRQVRNVHDFAGMLVLDKWSCNTDRRQVAFFKTLRERAYSATFIDHGNCFGAGAWNFVDGPLQGIFGQTGVYSDVTGWDSFEPVLSRILSIDPQAIWKLALQVPVEWYDADAASLERLIEKLLIRRARLHELLAQFRDCDRQPFPGWSQTRAFAMSMSKYPSLAALDQVPEAR